MQFRGRYNRWIKEVKTHFYILKFQREKDLFVTQSIVYIQILNAYLPEFLNVLLYVKANPEWMCR